MTAERMAEAIGAEAVGDWVEVTQAMIDRFADATGDRQFIHVDPAQAQATRFGGTIAHGFLTLSMMPMLAATARDLARLEGGAMTVNYGCDKVRFLCPVRAGGRIRGRFALLDFAEKSPGRYRQVTAVTIEIEGGDKPAMVAEWIGLTIVQP